MMVLCKSAAAKLIWSSIHEKVKQHWGWVEKKALFIKKSVYITKENLPGGGFKIFAKFWRRHLCRRLLDCNFFLKKKRGSDTGRFLRILRNL